MKKLLPYIMTVAYLLVGQTERALAQSAEFGSDVLNGLVTATGTRSLFEMVTGIINTALYFLGGIAVLLGLYAGWLWFSSRGNSDQIDKAKKIMISAVIGLAIIFASYAITNFVIGNLYNNVLDPNNSNSSSDDDDDDNSAIAPCPAPENGEMVICSYSSPKPVGGYVTISGWNFGDFIDVATSRVSIGDTSAPLVSCNSRLYWNQRFTRGANIYYQVKVITPNISVGGPYEILIENTVAGVPRQTTRSGFMVSAGLPGPSIACFEPEEGQRGTPVVAHGINFGTTGDNRNISMTGWNGAAAAPTNVEYTNWTDTEISFTIPGNALASDVFISNDIFATDPTDAEFFKVTCDATCSEVCCRSNECRPADSCSGSTEITGPRINHITPDNGAVQNLITIQGSGFGSVRGNGHVEFVDAANNATPAPLPDTLNNNCQNLWTNTDIIVGVPASLANGLYGVRVYPDNATTPSAPANFTVNNIDRPGICFADPNSGALNREVAITGVGFVNAVGNTVKYGGIVGYNTTINETTNRATSNVPNLQTGLVGIQLNAGENNSNPYPFSITEAIAGNPSVVNITPSTGPAGTYLTINGTNFGNSRGQTGNVLFELGASRLEADFTFPLQCTNSTWSSGRILVKVPTTLAVGSSYNVKVLRSDGQENNDTNEFTLTAGAPGPGLCAIFPDNGPRNSEVDFYGDNFGDSAGQIKFYNNQNSSTNVWTNHSALNVPVPNNAETGPVVVTANGQDSNAFNFRVGSCSNNNDCNAVASEVCCQNSIGNYCATSCSNARMCTYGWSFMTQPTAPTPLSVDDHWPACDSSCGNAEIGVGFNVFLDNDSATDVSNYTITDVTNQASPVDITIDEAILTENANATLPAIVILDYAGSLQVNHTYHVVVSEGVLSEEAEHTFYEWEFTVGQGICVFTGVDISPADYTASRPNQTINYQAAPTADINICGPQRLTCDNCAYDWDITPATPAIASIVGVDNAKNMRARSTSITVPPTITGLNNVQCRITQNTTANATGMTSLSIDYRSYLESLVVTEHYPDCVGACANAVVGMHFNSVIDMTTLTTTNNNVAIYDTDSSTPNQNIATSITVITNNIEAPNSESVFTINHQPLTTGHRYQVVISRAVQNMFTNSLANEFVWYFSVGTEQCVVTAATVVPAGVNIVANGRDRNLNYSIQTTSNTIACGNIPVNCSSCTYNWSSSVDTVADISGSPTTRNTVVTVPQTTTTGTTNIRCQVTPEAAHAPINAEPGILSVTANTSIYGIPVIESYSPEIASTEQCRNTAIEIVFSERMNPDSIRNNLRLLDVSNVAVAGTYSFSAVDGLDEDVANDQTRVLFSPTEVLATDSVYRVSLGTGIVSVNDVPLDLNATPRLNNWTFRTGTEICKISYVRLSPSEDWFTCGGNSCEGDDHPATEGNQHDYTATAYSRQATAITGANFSWQVNPADNSIISLAPTANQNEVIATAESENGEARVSVRASGIISGVDLGSASASMVVTVFLCQNPWPHMATFPWTEATTNFSTFYCARFDANSATLPYLTSPSESHHDSSILTEYIFTVNVNSTTAKNNSLGSLAYYLPKFENDKKNVWQRIFSLMGVNKAFGQDDIPEPTVLAPNNVNVAANGAEVTVVWTLPRRTSSYDHFEVQRKLTSASTWEQRLNIPGNTPETNWTWVDRDVPNGIYNYQVVSFGVDGSSAASSQYTTEVNASASSETNFIIFRVMPNVGHLSVQEWYKEKFPSDALGTMTTVDGYEAMRVGNTIYISAANIASGRIYTNIYIIAYSIGANPQTKAIYDQFVSNFQLNTNANFSAINDDNLCSVPVNGNQAVCSSDFDCSNGGGRCQSRSLKLRRDVKRLTDLLPVKKYLTQYGEAHKACAGNSQISCSDNSQCGTLGDCVNYYPQLNAGTFVPGQTNSQWPSWQQTLASDLRQTLPVDPINRFTACGDLVGADPATCWKESTREFDCRDTASIYGYLLQNNGQSYTLYSHFEYDPISLSSITFAANLYNGSSSGISAIGNISTDLGDYCSEDSSLPNANSCGNGVVEADENEECEPGQFLDNQCYARVGPHNWWNEQVTGCNPVGSPQQCRWYVRPLTAEMCGGYCGDNRLQVNSESCDIVSNNLVANGQYSCAVGNPTCNTSCNMVCGGGSAAARCGDGVWTSGVEQCDASASPNGLNAWDCPNNGNVQCNACAISCDNVATPYQGRCGDGIVQTFCSNNINLACTTDNDCVSPGTCTHGELCDYGLYPTPFPATADGAPTAYSCSQSCNFTNQPYCGDRILQSGYREFCDTNLLVPVTPAQSNQFNQYQCRMSNDTATNLRYTRCTPTIGGYCGDGDLQSGEACEPTGYVVDAAHPSSPTHQYQCDEDCQTLGGYCGDGILNSGYEACDSTASPNGLSGWDCPLGGTISCSLATAANACHRICNNGQAPYYGQCGNDIVEAPEQCEGDTALCTNLSSNFVAGVTQCLPNTCSAGSTVACCNVNGVSAKFLADNSFRLYVNGTVLGFGFDWRDCANGLTQYGAPASYPDERGSCEFRITNTNIFDYNDSENVLAFTATDTGIGAGVVGTFSCQSMTCKRVCYQGANAGGVCTNSSECPDGTCIAPDPGMEGMPCTWNNQCKEDETWPFYEYDRVSLCLPDDYGITTSPGADSLWHCTEQTQTNNNWQLPNFFETPDWQVPHDPLTGTFNDSWPDPNYESYWQHMVPGARPFWLGTSGSLTSPKTIYCRYVIRNGS